MDLHVAWSFLTFHVTSFSEASSINYKDKQPKKNKKHAVSFDSTQLFIPFFNVIFLLNNLITRQQPDVYKTQRRPVWHDQKLCFYIIKEKKLQFIFLKNLT